MTNVGSDRAQLSRMAQAAREAMGKTTLKAGDMAPDFTLKGSDSKEYTLSQFKGKNPVVLAFFPLAFTGG